MKDSSLVARALLACVTATFTLTACSQGTGVQRRSPLLANQAGAPATSAHDRFAAALDGRTGETRRVGTDRFLQSANGSRQPLIEASGTGEYTLNLVEVPITQAADAVLGQALGRTYAVSPDVSGNVTLQTSRPLSEAALLEVFQTVLGISGATLDVDGEVVTVVPSGTAPGRITRLGNPIGAGSRLVAVPLQYIGTTEMVRLLEPIVGTSVRISPIENRNVLLIAGNRSELNAAIDAVNVFDIDIMEGRSVGVFPLEAASPQDVVQELNLVFEAGSGGSLENVVTFVPSDRLGAVVVITSRANYLAEAEQWINDFDRAAGGVQRRPVVYPLQNRNATDMVPVLSAMLEQGDPEGSIEGATRIAADGANNAIVVWGNSGEQEAFARLIQSLDTAPMQVLLETTIAEITLNDELNFGLRWFFEEGDFRGTFSDVGTGSTGSTFPGLSFTFQGLSAGIALNALSSITDVEIVSSPSILVLDNQPARLQIGDQVPVATQQVVDATTPNAPVINTISFRDTGIILNVRPRVSEAGTVLLEIDQEVSSVSSTTTSGIDSPTISQRRIETTVSITDGMTIALGGLIQESGNRSNAQVPMVGDVPMLGALFRNRSDRVVRTELLILITPRVIRNGEEARGITQELRTRFGDVNSLVIQGVVTPSNGHRIID